MLVAMQTMWYFIWYGRTIANGELVIGCVTMLFFGYSLIYSVTTATAFTKRKWGIMALSASLCAFFFSTFCNLLKQLADVWSGGVANIATDKITTPFGINEHLFIPVIFGLLIFICFIWAVVLSIYNCWSNRTVFHKDDYYAGKVFIDNTLKRKY